MKIEKTKWNKGILTVIVEKRSIDNAEPFKVEDEDTAREIEVNIWDMLDFIEDKFNVSITEVE